MNVFRTFFEGRALVSKDSNRSPIHLKIELDNGTDFEEKLDNVEVYGEFWPSVCLVKISAWHDFLPCWIFQQHMPHSIMHLMAWSRQRRHPHSKWPHRETNNTNSLLWWKDYLLWWQTTNFLVVLPWALLTNKWYYYPDDSINLGIPARLQSGYDRFSDMLADWFSCPCFFPFLLSKAPLDPIETLISKVADYLMYWKNSSVKNWLEKTTTTPNYATWNTNELFSVHALANAMSRFRLEFGVNKHL